MKNLKLIGVVVSILLIALIIYSSSGKDIVNSGENNDITNKEEENVSKNGEVLNNGGSVLEYSGYRYYVKATMSPENGFDNKLCRIKIEDGTEEVLYNGGQYKLDNRLIIFKDNLFFNAVGQTYRINLKNSNSFSEYNKGVLYWIGDGNLIYAHNNNILKGTYYEKTLGINSASPIANCFPTFMCEDEENLYFYSSNVDNSKSIISVNKQNQTANVLNRIYADENKTVNILDFKLSKNYLYLIIESDIYEIRRIKKDGSDISSVNIDSKITYMNYTLDDSYYFKLDNDLKLYKYNVKENKIEETQIPSKAPDIYTVKLNGGNIELYKNEEILTTLLKGIEQTPKNISIEKISENLYIRFELEDNDGRDIIFFNVKEDGSDLIRLNNI